jgi:hypothetical protein
MDWEMEVNTWTLQYYKPILYDKNAISNVSNYHP